MVFISEQIIYYLCSRYSQENYDLEPKPRWYITAANKKMKKHLIILSTLVLFAFCSCSKFAGEPISKDFSISSNYTKLEVEDAFDVTVSDVATQVTITAGENVMPNVVVETVENTLKIYLKGWHNNLGKDMTVILPYNADLTSVDLSGASEFHSGYGLEGDKVEVELSGASDFYCDIDADEVDIDLSGASKFNGDIFADEIEMDLTGSSNIKGYVEALDLDLDMSGASNATFEGQVGTLKINLTGASDIKKTINGNRYGFTCDQCEGTMIGASNVYIHCDGTIKVNLSGASDLHFTGSAFTGDCTISGGSDIYHDTL